MYTRLIQGYEAMDPELQAVSASSAGQLRLMVMENFQRKCKLDFILLS